MIYQIDCTVQNCCARADYCEGLAAGLLLVHSLLWCTLFTSKLYCTVLYCCTVLYWTVMDCTVQHCTVVLNCIVLNWCTELYCTELYCTVLNCTARADNCVGLGSGLCLVNSFTNIRSILLATRQVNSSSLSLSLSLSLLYYYRIIYIMCV